MFQLENEFAQFIERILIKKLTKEDFGGAPNACQKYYIGLF